VLRVRAPPHPNLTSPDSYDSANWSSHRATDPSVRWGCAMKRFFLILIAGFALVMAHDFNGVHAGDDSGGEGGGIPLSKLASKYAETFPGAVFYICFKPDFSTTENCFTKGAVPVADIGATVAQETTDKDGDSCSNNTFTLALSGLTTAFPPTVFVFHAVSKVTNYDPATGSGDASFTQYTGGKCIGSKFDSTGATSVQTGTYHFVASDNGKRVDSIATTFISVVGDIGAFSIPALDLKQE
jgi:hypothetical protein